MNDTCGYDFSIGGRFHGNVISLWNNTKSLFLYVDSRTKELTDHFKLPSMDIRDFDKDMPIEFYYEKADYSEFNKNYRKRFFEFKEFLDKNGLEISNDVSIKQFAKDMYEKKEYIETKTKYLYKNNLCNLPQIGGNYIGDEICNCVSDLCQLCIQYGKVEGIKEIFAELLNAKENVPSNLKEKIYIENDVNVLRQEIIQLMKKL